MAHALGMRATSLASSAGLLALIVVAALSVTYTAHWQPPENAPVVEGMRDIAPPPTPPQARPQQPPIDQAEPLNPLPTQTMTPLTAFEPVPYAGPAAQPQSFVAITNPRWSRTPRDLARYYPARALAMSIEGQAVLDCLVGTDGRLACSVVSETPSNWGFGAAAVRISEDYRMVPAMRDGVAVEGRYRMRVPFDIR
ncbi:TonB family protein [Terricaulis sp.]|uniref:TonB family protein n=1 Tax=Terricaulis sp. TaxID=2768686 RepID=UPI00378444CB